MDEPTRALSEAELAVVRETDPERLAGLDEDELLDLHTRVRRARNKYTGQYRRQAGARVPVAGARGAARPRNRRAAERAEVFEAALARVSIALARAARRSAARLRTERLAAARTARSGPGPRPATNTAVAAPPAAVRPPVKSAARRKRDASSKAAGARRQARQDSR